MDYEARPIRQILRSIPANTSSIFSSFQVPQGYCGFVDYVYCTPDLAGNVLWARPRINSAPLQDIFWSVNPGTVNGSGMNMLRPAIFNSKQEPILLGNVPQIGVTNYPDLMTAIPVGPNDYFDIECFAGATAVSQNVEIGYRIHLMDNDYLTAALGQVYQPAFYITDPFKGTSIRQVKSINVSITNARTLPGGDKQSTPRIRPWIRFPKNNVATTAGQDFTMTDLSDYKNNTNLVIDQNTCLLLDYLGVAPHAYHLYTYCRIAERVYPATFWETDPIYNELPLGDPQTDYQGPMHIPSGSLLAKLWNKSFRFYIRDNGTSIPAYGTMLGLWGRIIELGA